MVNELYHHGIKGMRWGVRRFQNKDGTLTNAGKKHQEKLFNKELGKVRSDYEKEFDDKVVDKIGNKIDQRIEELVNSNKKVSQMRKNWDGDGTEFCWAVFEHTKDKTLNDLFEEEWNTRQSLKQKYVDRITQIMKEHKGGYDENVSPWGYLPY